MPPVASEQGAWVEPTTRRTLRYRLWHPQSPRALLVVIHGFGEHSGRYEAFAQPLVEQGVVVAAADLWGHGRSSGARGDLGDLPRCIDNLITLTQQVFLPASGQTTYTLFGHSMGGLLAAYWALHRPAELHHAILQSPLLEVGFPIPAWKTLAAIVLARAWPSCRIQVQLDVSILSHDPAVVEAYRVDPLVHHIMSARTHRSLLHTRDEVRDHAEAIRTPLWVLCGAEERVISVSHVQQWYARLTCEKHLYIFPDCYHELHHEPIRNEVFRLITDSIVGTPT